MKCTELLIEDHILLRRGLAVVDGMLRKLEDGQRIEIADAATILKFLKLFGDQYHQAMEESVLFPALIRAAPHETAFRQFVSEHGEERSVMGQIEDALISRRATVFFRGARQLTALFRNHCDREEGIVCDLAEKFLSMDHDEAIVAEFMKSRSQVLIYTNFTRLERRYGVLPAFSPNREVAARL